MQKFKCDCRLRVGQEAKVGYSSGSGSFELAVDVEQFAQRMRLAHTNLASSTYRRKLYLARYTHNLTTRPSDHMAPKDMPVYHTGLKDDLLLYLRARSLFGYSCMC